MKQKYILKSGHTDIQGVSYIKGDSIMLDDFELSGLKNKLLKCVKMSDKPVGMSSAEEDMYLVDHIYVYEDTPSTPSSASKKLN